MEKKFEPTVKHPPRAPPLREPFYHEKCLDCSQTGCSFTNGHPLNAYADLETDPEKAVCLKEV